MTSQPSTRRQDRLKPPGPPAVTSIQLDHFTAFESLNLLPSRGINVFVGANGTGKTHLMKVTYAACDAAKKRERFAAKLTRIFLPADGKIGRLAERRRGGVSAMAAVKIGNWTVRTEFSSRTTRPEDAEERIPKRVPSVNSVYIPVKEMLANAPGCRSLYAERAIHFEEVYSDLLDKAYLPLHRGAPDDERGRLLGKLRGELRGSILVRDEVFYWKGGHGTLEFSLLAEGLRKLALLWLLIQNGTLLKGSVLFWDEPEANLNPTLLATLAGVLLELQRLGVQVFLATHDYVLLKQLDLQQGNQDEIQYHALHRDADGHLACNSTGAYLDIRPNAIDDAFGAIYDSEVKRSLRHR